MKRFLLFAVVLGLLGSQLLEAGEKSINTSAARVAAYGV